MDSNTSADHWAHEVIGAAIEVHRILGPGFREAVYEESLAHEFRLRKIPFVRQMHASIMYKGVKVGRGRMDFLVDGCLVVDTKATESLPPLFVSQVLSYLKAMKLHLGLLINFNEILLKNGIRRVILS